MTKLNTRPSRPASYKNQGQIKQTTAINSTQTTPQKVPQPKAPCLQGAKLTQAHHTPSNGQDAVHAYNPPEYTPQIQAPTHDPRTRHTGVMLQASTDNVTSEMQQMALSQPEKFQTILSQAFGEKLSQDKLQELTKQAQNRKLPFPANIEFLPAEQMKGGKGAYSPANGGTIYLNESLANNPLAMERTLLEEFGHHLDHKLGGTDSRGDEGEMFQTAIQQGHPLSKGQLHELKQQRDVGTLNINGQEIMVEFNRGKGSKAKLKRPLLTNEKVHAPKGTKLYYEGRLEALYNPIKHFDQSSKTFNTINDLLKEGKKVLRATKGQTLTPEQVQALKHYTETANKLTRAPGIEQGEKYSNEGELYSYGLGFARALKHGAMATVDEIAQRTGVAGRAIKGLMHGGVSFVDAYMSGENPKIAALMATLTGVLQSLSGPHKKGLSKGEKIGEAVVLSVHQTLHDIGKKIDQSEKITPEFIAKSFSKNFGKRAVGLIKFGKTPKELRDLGKNPSIIRPDAVVRVIGKTVVGLLVNYYDEYNASK